MLNLSKDSRDTLRRIELIQNNWSNQTGLKFHEFYNYIMSLSQNELDSFEKLSGVACKEFSVGVGMGNVYVLKRKLK